MPDNQINLLDVLGNRATVSIDPVESSEELAARIRSEERHDRLDIVKGYVVFFIILAALIAVGSLCAYAAVFDSTATPDTKRWAQTALSALFSGSISFFVGQMTVKKK